MCLGLGNLSWTSSLSHDGLESNSSRIISLYILLKFYRTFAAPLFFYFFRTFLPDLISREPPVCISSLSSLFSLIYLNKPGSPNTASSALLMVLRAQSNSQPRSIPNPAPEPIPTLGPTLISWDGFWISSLSAKNPSGTFPTAADLLLLLGKAKWDHRGFPFQNTRRKERNKEVLWPSP